MANKYLIILACLCLTFNTLELNNSKGWDSFVKTIEFFQEEEVEPKEQNEENNNNSEEESEFERVETELEEGNEEHLFHSLPPHIFLPKNNFKRIYKSLRTRHKSLISETINVTQKVHLYILYTCLKLDC